MIKADLHTHTYYSDGAQSPEDVVRAAKANGVNILAVTDHDNALAEAEVKSFAEKYGVTAVGGIEISAYDGDVKVHVLGYNLNFACPAFIKFYKKLKEGSLERTRDVLKKLCANGVEITLEEVLSKRFCAEAPVHASHIAQAAVARGYEKSAWNFYAKYLCFGACAFSTVGRPTPEEAVSIIKDCGGISSLAHPARLALEKEGVISLTERLVKVGLNGIEAMYSGHTVRETQYYKELAERYDLLVTGGSDTHFQGGKRTVGVPAFQPDDALLSALKII